MRLYSITNMYMNGIHSGIQTQHSTVEAFVKYPNNTPQHSVLLDWATYHKTTVVLNGGMHDQLMELLALLEKWENEEEYEVLPFAPFFEPGVNNALTSISIVMPQDAIEYMSELRSVKPGSIDEAELMTSMYNSYGRYGIPVLQAIAFLPLAK